MTAPTDPLYADQWHFDLLGDIEAIWSDHTGAGVSVYVVDDGIEYAHGDLDDNYDAAGHFRHDGEVLDPTPVTRSGTKPDAHGTAVGGIIAAEAGNGFGGVGVAHGATLTGLNLIEDVQTRGDAALYYAAIEHARNFDISSNSWTFAGLYDDYQNLADPTSAADAVIDSYDLVASTGRGGLGTVLVQAAGNGSANANGDGLNVARQTITVAAVDRDGEATSYTNYGANILVAAGAASVTTDLVGADGYNDDPQGDFTTTFGGTSAATPVVSGVVALMLDAAPGLGWRDVQDILASSARLTGALDGTTAHSHAWSMQESGTWNGGGHAFNWSYGFGLVDAYAAVRMAEVWQRMHGAAGTSANELHLSTGTGAISIATADYDPETQQPGLTAIELYVGQNIRVEDATLTLDIAHGWAGDLDISLVAPDGTSMTLMSQEGESHLMDGGFTWAFGATGFLGLDALGTWTLLIADMAESYTGTVREVMLDLYGAATRADDVHHITADFREAAAMRAGPTVIADDDGGTDWLNLASLQGDVTLDLSETGLLAVDGEQWGEIATGAAFENAALGDGNDLVTGNAADNILLGRRGDDTLEGGGGFDTLEGGDGVDTLSGGAGADRLRGGFGDDTLRGDDGADQLFGGGGFDTLRGGPGADLLRGEGQADNLFGEAGDDRLDGGDGRDRLWGGAGDDSIAGGAGDDALWGEAGADTLLGGGGFDRLWGADGADTLYGQGQADDLFGGGASDHLHGGDGRDRLSGDAGDDRLFGDGGNDVLRGGGGYDILDGGAGDDTLWGNANWDIFVFTDGWGEDRIADFDALNDLERIDFCAVGGIVDFNDLAGNHMSQSGDDVLIDDLAGSRLWLTGVALADLDTADFLFA